MMPCKINIIIETARPCPKKTALKNAARRALAVEGIKNSISLNLLFTDNKKLKDLNKRFLGRNAPTDVIAFDVKNRALKGFIGEVAISIEEAQHNADRFNTSAENEIFLYIIHGILHLLGYRDDTKSQMRIMEGRQDKILQDVLCAS